MMFSFSTLRPILVRRRYRRRLSSSKGTCTRATRHVSSTNTVLASTGMTYRKDGTRHTPVSLASASGSACRKSMNTTLFTSNGWPGMFTSMPYAVCHPGLGPCSYRSMSRLCPVLHTTTCAATSNVSRGAPAAAAGPGASGSSSDPSWLGADSVPFTTEGSPLVASPCTRVSTSPGAYLTPAARHLASRCSRRRRRHTWPYCRPRLMPPAGLVSSNHTSASSYVCSRQCSSPISTKSSIHTP
mmetsp:Transcript_17135/g.42161  ORF Transcript_17135/g.42161 Transcript_17135/m.42161 type:complete len:242 (-) Transcript_17135:1463-2188(-)